MAVSRPSLPATLARIAVLTVVATALSFAVTLLVSIISLAIVSAARHTHVDMSIAYRVIGVRAVLIAAPLALVVIGALELRGYVRARNEARPLKFVNQ
jgi:hypothetical protein